VRVSRSASEDNLPTALKCVLQSRASSSLFPGELGTASQHAMRKRSRRHIVANLDHRISKQYNLPIVCSADLACHDATVSLRPAVELVVLLNQKMTQRG